MQLGKLYKVSHSVRMLFIHQARFTCPELIVLFGVRRLVIIVISKCTWEGDLCIFRLWRLGWRGHWKEYGDGCCCCVWVDEAYCQDIPYFPLGALPGQRVCGFYVINNVIYSLRHWDCTVWNEAASKYHSCTSGHNNCMVQVLQWHICELCNVSVCVLKFMTAIHILFFICRVAVQAAKLLSEKGERA